MLKKIIKIITTSSLLLALFVINIKAVSTSVVIIFDKQEYTPNETVVATIRYNHNEPALVQMNLSSNNATINGSTTRATSNWETNGSFVVNMTAPSSGKFSLSANVVELVNKNDEVSSESFGATGFGKVKEVVVSNNQDTTTTTVQAPPTPEEKPDTTQDNVSVAPPVYRQKEDRREEVPIGTVTPIENNRTKSSNNFIKNVVLEGGELDFHKEFSSDINDYTVRLIEGFEEVKIKVELEDSKATVDSNEKTLKVGERIEFKVISEDKQERIYSFKLENSYIWYDYKQGEDNYKFRIYTNPIGIDRLKKTSITFNNNLVDGYKIQDRYMIVALRKENDKKEELFYYDTKENKIISPFIETVILHQTFILAPVDKEMNPPKDMEWTEFKFRDRDITVLVKKGDKENNVYIKVINSDMQEELLRYNKDSGLYYRESNHTKDTKNEKNTIEFIMKVLLGVIVSVAVVGGGIYFYYERKIRKNN